MRPGFMQALMVAPVQSLLVAVLAIPALWIFWLSLTESSYGLEPTFVGWSNYAFVLTDTYFWRAFVNTLIVV